MAVVTLLLGGGAVRAQDPRIYSEPPVPPREALERLNLRMAWRTYLPTDRRRDGIFSLRVINRPHGDGQQVLVQLRSGAVVLLDAETGATEWRSRVGTPYLVNHPPGFNANYVFVVNGLELFALDRATGRPTWEFSLPQAAAASPAADEERVYLPVGGDKLNAYDIPRALPPGTGGARKIEAPPTPTVTVPEPAGERRPASALGVSGQSVRGIGAVSSIGQSVRSVGALTSAAEASRQFGPSGLQPYLLWDMGMESRTDITPLVTNDFLLVGSEGGSFYVMEKLGGKQVYRLHLGPPVTAQMARHGETAYIASEDFSVTAVDIVTGRVYWRFATGGPNRRKPVVTDTDVFVANPRSGLYRLDRLTGSALWRNPQAKRFLAVNRKFVYASDPSGRLLVLDGTRGTELATFAPAFDFVVPAPNDLTDRLFLVSNDGLVVCLHDRDYVRPWYLVASEGQAPPPAVLPAPKSGAPRKPAPKPDEDEIGK
jgi:outer membrane protein assembly factor BamB